MTFNLINIIRKFFHYFFHQSGIVKVFFKLTGHCYKAAQTIQTEAGGARV